MQEHPIESLMETAMNNIQGLVDVNTIIGDAIEIKDNICIIPISKVSFGFAAGGSEFSKETVEEYSRRDENEEIKYKNPFGGGSRSRCRNITNCIFSYTRRKCKINAS